MPYSRIMVVMLYGWLVCLLVSVNPVKGTEDNCRSCHGGMHTSCGLTCGQCHVSPNGARPSIEPNHQPVIANPSRTEYWPEKCISCHREAIESFKQSRHYRMDRIIYQTRYLWGKTDTLDVEGRDEAWKSLKALPRTASKKPEDLVDHLLAAKCMRCHFEASGKQNGPGRKRPAGCAACHIQLHQKTGRYVNGHRLQKPDEDAVCLTCHSGNYVGADYYGYFEHDYHRDYQTPYGSTPRFSAYQHSLQPDIHQQAGMSCMDCHYASPDSGKGKHLAGYERRKPRCQSCHGGFAGETAQPDIPAFNPKNTAHQDFHSKVKCSACHARWSFQDYGMHLFLDETNHYTLWEDFMYQGDQYIVRWLQKELPKKPQNRQNSTSINRLSGSPLPGIWYKAWTFRRWEDPVLGMDAGRYSILRPLYQYYITYVDSSDNVWLDSQKPHTEKGEHGWSWDAYSPHTTGRKGRKCESCHGSAKAVGLGIRQSLRDSVAHEITLPSDPVVPGVRLLTPAEQEKLLRKSETYKKWRAREFYRQGMDEWFKD
ncbi:MAG: hypothetical protein GF313_14690 [Caldithrix sp.]|nr:hypothetical protein [Caldithrix sp.]